MTGAGCRRLKTCDGHCAMCRCPRGLHAAFDGPHTAEGRLKRGQTSPRKSKPAGWAWTMSPSSTPGARRRVAHRVARQTPQDRVKAHNSDEGDAE